MAKKTNKKSDLIKKRQKKALDMAIEGSESFLGKLKSHTKKRKKKDVLKAKEKQARAAAKRKKMMKIYGGGGAVFILLIVFGVHWLLQPRQGTILYGACKNFLELNVRYPDYLRLASVEEIQEDGFHIVRIWHSRLDAYGQYNMERMFCYFNQDETGVIALKHVTINTDITEIDRREFNPEKVALFSAGLPGILEGDTDLSYPLDFPSRISDLQFKPDLFRNPIFGRRRR